MNNLANKITNTNIDKNLISNRINIILFSYGLNEFYNAFKYLKSILIYLINKNDFSKYAVKEAIERVAKYNALNSKSIVSALGKLYAMLPKDFFISSPLFAKIKMNCYHKTQFITETVLKDIEHFN